MNEIVNDNCELLTRKEAASYLRICVAHLDNLTRKKKIKTVSMGRKVFYTLKHLNEIIDAGGTE